MQGMTHLGKSQVSIFSHIMTTTTAMQSMTHLCESQVAIFRHIHDHCHHCIKITIMTTGYVKFWLTFANPKSPSSATNKIHYQQYQWQLQGMTHLCKSQVTIFCHIHHLDLPHAQEVIVFREDKWHHSADDSSQEEWHDIAGQHGVVLKCGVVCNGSILDLQT